MRHHLRVRLNHVKPPVTRELVVPSNLSLDRLHQVLQVAMGWENIHLHEFIVDTGRDGRRFAPLDGEMFDLDDKVEDESLHTLADIVPHKGGRLQYWYDFGDDWEHSITVTAVREAQPDEPVLYCRKAMRACPPENSGGPWGYAEMLQVRADPEHDEHEETVDWLGFDFDPDFCDIGDINATLGLLARRWRLTSARGKPTAGSTPLMLGAARGQVLIDMYQAVLEAIAGPAPEGTLLVNHLISARDLLLREPGRLQPAVAGLRAKGVQLDDKVLLALRDLRVQRWYWLRDTRSHSVFLTETGDAAYGVLGLMQRLRDMTETSGLVVETALMSYDGRIVCDGLIQVHATIGPNFRRDLNDRLAQLRATGRYATDAFFPAVAEVAPPGTTVLEADACIPPIEQAGDATNPPDPAGKRQDFESGSQATLLPLVPVTQGRRATGAQRDFNRLIAKIQERRQSLITWREWLAGFSGRMAEGHEPLLRQQYDAELNLVRRLDVLLEEEFDLLTNRQYVTLRRYLIERLGELAGVSGPADDELSGLLRKHTGRDIHTLRAAENQKQMQLMEALLGDVFGARTVAGHQAGTPDDLLRHIEEVIRAGQAAGSDDEQATAAGRQRARRQQAAEKRREEAEAQASQSVRDIFRKLASTLHPDREADPVQRQRKTDLMQQATRAYQDNDLLQLLTLQFQIEQIDNDHLAGLPDAQLKHYNAVLRDQVAALDREILDLVAPVAAELDVFGAPPRKADLERALAAQIAQLDAWIVDAGRELAALDDRRARQQLVSRIARRYKTQDEEELDSLFGGMPLDPYDCPPESRRPRTARKP